MRRKGRVRNVKGREERKGWVGSKLREERSNAENNSTRYIIGGASIDYTALSYPYNFRLRRVARSAQCLRTSLASK